MADRSAETKTGTERMFQMREREEALKTNPISAQNDQCDEGRCKTDVRNSVRPVCYVFVTATVISITKGFLRCHLTSSVPDLKSRFDLLHNTPSQ